MQRENIWRGLINKWWGEKRWETQGGAQRGPSPLRGQAEHPSARLPCHEFPGSEYHNRRRGKKEILGGKSHNSRPRLSKVGFFHIIARCWVKVVFLNSFFSLPSGATYVLRCPALRRCFPAAGGSSCRVFFKKQKSLWRFRFCFWVEFLPLNLCSSSSSTFAPEPRQNEWLRPLSPLLRPKTSGGDGSDRPRQLPPPAGQSVQLSPAAPLGLAYYLFQVTRDEQILCAWPLPCSRSLSHAHFSHWTDFFFIIINSIPCKHENKDHNGSQICSKAVLK